jgi:CheY-like chemotaxis protein
MPKLERSLEPRAPRILVVEDDTFVRIALCEDLREAGLAVVEAASAEEALSYLSVGERIDLVFTDIQLPGRLDGIALARQLRTRHPALPVVLTSGNTVPPGDLEGSLFIPKPYDHRHVAEIALEVAGPKPREAE